jgi:hypothetical protein
MSTGLDAGTELQVLQELKADRCRVTTRRVVAIKERLVARYRVQGIPAEVVREAIAAAEAQAWGSGYPHLFLPGLADEMVEQLRQKRSSIHPELAQAA